MISVELDEIDKAKKKLGANVEVVELSADQINSFTEFEIR